MGARTGRAWLRDHQCERRTGNRTKPSGLPCSTGRRRHGLASCPSAAGAYPRLEMQAPIVPAPGACRRLQRSLPASTGRQRGVRSEALTASAPVAARYITDTVINVNSFHVIGKPRRRQTHRRWLPCHIPRMETCRPSTSYSITYGATVGSSRRPSSIGRPRLAKSLRLSPAFKSPPVRRLAAAGPNWPDIRADKFELG